MGTAEKTGCLPATGHVLRLRLMRRGDGTKQVENPRKPIDLLSQIIYLVAVVNSNIPLPIVIR